MKRCLSVLIFVGLFLSAVYCGSAEGARKGPQAYLPETVFEFKPVVEGTEIVHKFILQNRGDAVLEILKIESG